MRRASWPTSSPISLTKWLIRPHAPLHSTDGRTLNQAYLECASLAAAQKIVRARDGTYLGSRPVHVSLSSQTELLQTVRIESRLGPLPRPS